jgi:ABC-type Mn2+/Zn2+ transport system ATPase subunit
MPSSKFIVEIESSDTFKAKKVKSMFDCNMDTIKKEFDVNIPIEGMNWNIGLIVGASGTGKTTIAKQVFKDFTFFSGFEWVGKSIIDDFGDNTAKEITEILAKVGFASPPDWLKPFAVLSNGQKMRAELARLILTETKPFIYDEFTSVVDRQVACIGSAAIQKFIRKQNKQFIAVSCHYDIEQWLEPDWVFDCNKMEFYRGSLRRPEIECIIRKAEQHEWKQFKDFHYLSHDHNKAAHKYICEIGNQPVAWCSVLHFPHPHIKNMKRLHRTVVKPDYQGIGLGYKFRSIIAQMYKDKGYRIGTVTSNPALMYSMVKGNDWIMTRKPSRLKNTAKTGVLAGSTSDLRLTASFEYIGNKNE